MARESMKRIKLEPVGERDLVGPDVRYRLVFEHSNLTTVVHLTEEERDELFMECARVKPAMDHAFQAPHSGADECVEAVRTLNPRTAARTPRWGWAACGRPAAEHPAQDPA